MAAVKTPFTEYLRRYAELDFPMWDELAVAVMAGRGDHYRSGRNLFIDVEIDHGAAYGNTLSWTPGSEPGLGEQLRAHQRGPRRGSRFDQALSST